MIDALDARGETAFHKAAVGGHVEVMELLMHRQDFMGTNERDMHGLSPLHVAAERGNLEACRAVIKGPRFEDGRLERGMRAAEYARHREHDDVVRYLTQHPKDW